jgi:hypothetical protein
MNIDKMIDKFLQEEANYPQNSPAPIWAQEILKELKEIKSILLNKNKKRAYYNFVNKLRQEFKNDLKNNIYPKIVYNKVSYGINEKGHIYNMQTLKEVSPYLAYEIFEFLYKNRNNLKDFIIKN